MRSSPTSSRPKRCSDRSFIDTRGGKPMSRFQGKTIVITGASRGIGATLAKRFAREGGAVVASANEPACETVAADIVKAGGKAIAFVADVTKKGDVIALYEATERAFGGIDVSLYEATERAFGGIDVS